MQPERGVETRADTDRENWGTGELQSSVMWVSVKAIITLHYLSLAA